MKIMLKSGELRFDRTASNVNIQIHCADNISSLLDQEKRNRRLATTQRPIDEVLNDPRIEITREDMPDNYFEFN